MSAGHLTAAAQPNSVYRYYDGACRLIYVGMTARGIQRQQEHDKLSDWFQYSVTQQIEQCPDRDAALSLERELIRAYRPPFNKVHNEGWEPMRAAYLAVVAAERALADAQSGLVPEPRVCGHCPSCLGAKRYPDSPDEWGPWQPCRVIRPLDEDEEPNVCGECSDPYCAYQDGIDAGYEPWWKEGYDVGMQAERKRLLTEHAPTLRPAQILQWVVDGNWRRTGIPILSAPEGVTDSLTALEATLARVGVDGAIAELAERDPWLVKGRAR